ncbi:hypothetical protein [Rhodopirellula sp. MGV]|uniref:hypothetical protein n=1 Tax=Rhodopirellula sp. MGV TaxID=2023130 RepID=UPI00117A0DD9|nr:hypothetical protein [Rhodopirellula sp. MGV]
MRLLISTILCCFSLSGDSPAQDVFPEGPCGVYEVDRLQKNFQVAVEHREAPDGRYKVSIIVPNALRPSDNRRLFPRKDMVIVFRNEKEVEILKTPLAWRKRLDPVHGTEEWIATFQLAPEAVERVYLRRDLVGFPMMFTQQVLMLSLNQIGDQNESGRTNR